MVKHKITDRCITVDPGLGGTGYAIWDKNWELITNKVVHVASQTPLEERLFIFGDVIKRQIVKYDVKLLYIEYPSFFQSSKGIVTATGGGLVKLSTLIGVICGSSGIKYELVPVTKWKGQLPKSAVKKRIQKILPNVQAGSHDWDAIGIGLYKKGVF